MASTYRPGEIEPRWQQYWLDERTYEVDNDEPGETAYVLSMYPYPSGPAHIGHVRNYTFGDLLVRYHTMNGKKVLSPIGFDSFGLPAENAAIKSGVHPRVFTEDRIAELSASLRRIGAVYDWRRQVCSHDPEFMRWTQWIFKRFHEAGLAYRAEAPVNWCPGCQTVLANEQVLSDGTCERSGDLVERREMEQWFYRITDYAEQLLDDLDDLDWPERVKRMQRNWIGRSKGVEFALPIADADGTQRSDVAGVAVFTTRPDTGFGMTFAVMSPEHPRVDELTADTQRGAVEAFVAEVAERSDIERLASGGALDKRGVATGSSVINPFTGKPIPLFLADYVLMTYGTGAIMAVPGQDQRDWDFATAYGVDIVRTVQPPEGFEGEAYSGDGPAINSDWLDGLGIDDATAKAIDWIESEGLGSSTVNYRLRDWLLSRQRYWGCPIPMVYCDACGVQPVPDDELPIELPDDVEFMPTGQSPLQFHEGFLAATCPNCGGDARRETDTMDTFVDSSWYFLRYLTPNDDTKPFDSQLCDRWLPVDQYIGGVEHAIMHLLYARFVTKVIYDEGLIGFDEPFANLFTQGMICKKSERTGRLEVMSKSSGNVVPPEAIIEEYGTDTQRLYTLFIGPPERDAEWTDRAVPGCYRFLQRVWRQFRRVIEEHRDSGGDPGRTDGLRPEFEAFRRRVHETVKKITADF
ncbi:MAG: leucine--tRNA ligase, partial [Acidobacteria bacterium]|nr:leucine--tRNA ligase [Acidobacteriota bacterium]